jgi:hypothetical protein
VLGYGAFRDRRIGGVFVVIIIAIVAFVYVSGASEMEREWLARALPRAVSYVLAELKRLGVEEETHGYDSDVG